MNNFHGLFDALKIFSLGSYDPASPTALALVLGRMGRGSRAFGSAPGSVVVFKRVCP